MRGPGAVINRPAAAGIDGYSDSDPRLLATRSDGYRVARFGCVFAPWWRRLAISICRGAQLSNAGRGLGGGRRGESRRCLPRSPIKGWRRWPSALSMVQSCMSSIRGKADDVIGVQPQSSPVPASSVRASPALALCQPGPTGPGHLLPPRRLRGSVRSTVAERHGPPVGPKLPMGARRLAGREVRTRRGLRAGFGSPKQRRPAVCSWYRLAAAGPNGVDCRRRTASMPVRRVSR